MTGKQPRERRTKSPEQALAALMRLCARAEKAESDARRPMRGWADRFIDDRRYADAFVREKMRLSGWGAYKIRAALRRKGIAPETIDAAWAAVDPAGMGDRLRTQLARKVRTLRAATPRELKTKLIRYGLSLGYDYETVLPAAAEFIEECDACDDF